MSSVDRSEYTEGMERIDSNILEKVLDEAAGFDAQSYTERDVRTALSNDALSIGDFAALLSPAADGMLEEVAVRAKDETRRRFGNAVGLFTPIYLSNHCDGGCVYCGFSRDSGIKRTALSPEDAERKMRAVASTGLTDVLLLTGESRSMSGVRYIGECVRAASEHFRSVGIEVYPLNVSEYAYLRECGADSVTVFQETYDPEAYAELHLSGQKKVFSYRFDAQERALQGGMRGVAFGALLGLGDAAKDAFSCGVHAHMIQRKYPHAEISFSVPRLRPFVNSPSYVNPVSERRLLQVAMAYRIFMPSAGITVSTRESPSFRDNVIGLCATRISAGVSVSVDGGDDGNDGQFDISDERSVAEVRRALEERGMQPVFNDYVRT
ncbi:MAG: 2-iminoacetate synthase ThiH [Candidatus Methanoplasma sp.]|jgi:2-iminoacetate synthase|nr:2-iminoacetate synthase ThiH [Candidatus Methanoplasma sp.]